MDTTRWFPRVADLDEHAAGLLAVALEAAEAAARVHLAMAHSTYSVSPKELHDIVTSVDLQAEAGIRRVVASAFPDHSFASEESEATNAASIDRWVIDPLDGTVNFAASIPFYSASIAAQRNGETVVGVVYCTALDEVYVAVRGHGAYRNGEPIRVSTRNALSDCVVSFMLTSHYTPAQQDAIYARVRALSPLVRGLRLYVSQALELSYIASGRLDGHVCVKSRGYSGAAGVLILREAGGHVTDLQGVSFSNASRSVVASNGPVHEAILSAVRNG